MLLLVKWEVETNILELQQSVARARALSVSSRIYPDQSVPLNQGVPPNQKAPGSK